MTETYNPSPSHAASRSPGLMIYALAMDRITGYVYPSLHLSRLLSRDANEYRPDLTPDPHMRCHYEQPATEPS